MHPNHTLLDKLFAALGERNPLKIASCYHPKAHFRDIAFDLRGADDIYDMWRMICRPVVRLVVDEAKVVDVDDRAGRARLVETYRFGASEGDAKHKKNDGLKVTNEIESRFEFEDGLIKRQVDECDPKAWAEQAMKGHPIKAFLAGRVRLVRSLGAKKKLREFLSDKSK